MKPIIHPILEMFGIINHFLILFGFAHCNHFNCELKNEGALCHHLKKDGFCMGLTLFWHQSRQHCCRWWKNRKIVQVCNWTTDLHCVGVGLQARPQQGFLFQWFGCFDELWWGESFRWFCLVDVYFFHELLDRADDLKPARRIVHTSFQCLPQALLATLTKCFNKVFRFLHWDPSA